MKLIALILLAGLIVGGWWGLRPQSDTYAVLACDTGTAAGGSCRAQRVTETRRPALALFGLFTRQTETLHEGDALSASARMAMAFPDLPRAALTECAAVVTGARAISSLLAPPSDAGDAQSLLCKLKVPT